MIQTMLREVPSFMTAFILQKRAQQQRARRMQRAEGKENPADSPSNLPSALLCTMMPKQETPNRQ